MKTKEFKRLIDVYLRPFFNESGFETVCVDTYGFSIQKEETDKLFNFTVRKIDKGYLSLQPGSANIEFREVENAITLTAEKNNLNAGTTTFSRYELDENVLNLTRLVTDVKVFDEERFRSYAIILKKIFKDVILPFYKKYADIKEVSRFITTIDVKRLLDHFGGDFPLGFCKALFIVNKYAEREDYIRLNDSVVAFVRNLSLSESLKDHVPFYKAVIDEFCNALK